MAPSLFKVNRQPRCAIAAALAAISVLISIPFATPAWAAQRLSTPEEARSLGLKRAWFAQVRLDPARNRVERAILKGDRLYVLTTAGVLQEFNAATGETQWIAPIGNPNYPSLGPAASDNHVALLNGSTLYVLDRIDGRPVVIRPVGGAPGAAPAVGEKYVFVPLVRGRVEAYSLGEQKFTPWYYQSYGRAMVPPLATPQSFVWTTDSGHMYVGDAENLAVRFRLETASEIVAPPAYEKPYVYAATSSGEMFAMHEMTGGRRWKYATGFPVTRAPAAIADRVFVTSEEPALHCVDAKRGVSLWEAPKISQFAAVSKDRVYGVDDLGRIVALDAKTGSLLRRMPTDGETYALVNDQTDRVYLVSDEGVVQCFHELGADKPLQHKPVKTEQPGETSADPSAPAPSVPIEAKPTDPSQPDEGDKESPFEVEAEEAEMPAGESEDGEDPFDF